MRNVAIAVVALVMGGAVGAWVTHERAREQFIELERERDSALRKAEQALTEAEANAEQMRQVEFENVSLEKQARALEQEALAVAKRVATVDRASEPVDEAPIPPSPALASVGAASSSVAVPPEDPMMAMDEGSRKEREERRRAFGQEIRERRDAFFQQELQRTGDVEVQQRLGQMQAETDYLIELRNAMREAQTEEEQQQLRQSFGETMRVLHDLNTAQQEYLVREVAKEYGIKDPTRQDAFIASMRDMQSSPYFHPERVMGMGEDHRGGPPFGGGPSRGGGPARMGRPRQ